MYKFKKINIFTINKYVLISKIQILNLNDLCCNKNGINVGIIGGGMTSIYTAIILKQLKYINTINIIDTKDCLSDDVFDISNIDTSPKIKYYKNQDFNKAVSKSNIIALMDNADIKSSTNDPKEQFMMISNYIKDIAKRLVMICPSAIFVVFARPVTSTLPLVSEIFRRYGQWNPDKVIGSVGIDKMRIEAMAGNLFDLDPAFISIPIVGGADSTTVVPLITRAQSLTQISREHERQLINKLKTADSELEETNCNFNGPSMSSGVSGAKLISQIAQALSGQKNIINSIYIRSNIMPFCRFFTHEVQFGAHGVENKLQIPKISPLALELIEQAVLNINEQCKHVNDYLDNENIDITDKSCENLTCKLKEMNN